MATDTPRPLVTVTVPADQLWRAGMEALDDALDGINLHPDGRLYCRECRGLWTWQTGPIVAVIRAAMAHECPPARHVNVVTSDRT